MKKDVFNALVEAISLKYELSDSDLFKRSSKAKYNDPRQVLLFMSIDRGIKNVTLREYLSERGLDLRASDITYAIRSMESKIENDNDYVRLFRQLNNSVDEALEN